MLWTGRDDFRLVRFFKADRTEAVPPYDLKPFTHWYQMRSYLIGGIDGSSEAGGDFCLSSHFFKIARATGTA